MKYLAVDTCGNHLTVISVNGDKKEIFFDEDCGVNHSVDIMVRIEEGLNKTALNLADLDFIACAVGPGSFTGIRIGVATVKALCLAENKKCLPLTSFDILAYNTTEAKTLAVIDAGHNGFYVCGYDGGKVVLPPSFVFGEKVKELAEEYSVVSSKPLPLDFFKDGKKIISSASLKDGFLRAIEIKANRGEIVSAAELNPLYVRKSQAEEGR